MGLGVLEDHKLPHVPGTVILDDGVLPDVLEDHSSFSRLSCVC